MNIGPDKSPWAYPRRPPSSAPGGPEPGSGAPGGPGAAEGMASPGGPGSGWQGRPPYRQKGTTGPNRTGTLGNVGYPYVAFVPFGSVTV